MIEKETKSNMSRSSEDEKSRVYCEGFIKNLPVKRDFKKSFRDVLCKDSPGCIPQFDPRILDAICLDVDEMEIARSKDHQETMDLAFPIGLWDEARCRFLRERLLFVELKLNLTGLGFNLSPNNLSDKSRLTRLNFFMEHNTDCSDVFIVPSDKVAIAERNLSRWKNGSNGSRFKYWVFLDPRRFNAFVSFPEDYPYEFINKDEMILADMNAAYETHDIVFVLRHAKHWMVKGWGYRKEYNMQEAFHIWNVLSAWLHVFLKGPVDDEYLLNVEILIEEIENLKKSCSD